MTPAPMGRAPRTLRRRAATEEEAGTRARRRAETRAQRQDGGRQRRQRRRQRRRNRGADAGAGCIDDADAGSGTTDGGACNFTGTWGAEITIDVTWAAGGILNIVIAPGSGTIKQWLLSTRTQSGKTVTDTAVVCGIQLPDFQGNAQLVNETYGIRFPNSLFDNGGLTTFAINGTVSGSTPTATYTTTPAAALLGLTLANATTAVWPATITTEIDEDDDSKPGITANVVPPGGGYSYVPLDISVISFPTTVARADELYVVIRQVTSVTAQFSDCDHSSGSVTVPQITDSSTSTKKYAIDSHVIGCSVNGTETDCSANQTTFVDENQPVFTPTATTFVSARMPTGTTCATVRESSESRWRTRAQLSSAPRRPFIHSTKAGITITAVVRHATSPRTARSPKRKRAWFSARSSDEYPMIVVIEQSVTAPPGRTDRVDHRAAAVELPAAGHVHRVVDPDAERDRERDEVREVDSNLERDGERGEPQDAEDERHEDERRRWPDAQQRDDDDDHPEEGRRAGDQPISLHRLRGCRPRARATRPPGRAGGTAARRRTAQTAAAAIRRRATKSASEATLPEGVSGPAGKRARCDRRCRRARADPVVNASGTSASVSG